jgi:acyl-CoA dehydrogenase
MSGFGLSQDQLLLLDRLSALARTELAPLAAAGEPGRVNRALLRSMGEHGILRQLFQPSNGSGHRGANALEICLMREALAAVSTEAETALALQGLGSAPFVLFGHSSIAERWFDPVVAGAAVAAFAISEPDVGSDAASLRLSAERDGAGWRLHGEKMWISNAPEADVYTVFARTTPEAKGRGVTAFVVAGDARGLHGEHLQMLSPHPIGRLTFDGVRVAPDDVIGQVDQGFPIAMRTLDLFRPSVGAFAVGMGQAALDAAIHHTTTREAFGGRLCDQQAVAHMLAEMATRLEASRLLVYWAASSYDQGAAPADVSRRSAMAKLFATESAQFIVDSAVQLHGARGLQRGHLLEHLYREVRAPRIYEGASEVQRTIIGRALTRP